MLIDWFTVTAQIINFAILVWLLKRYLYNPILKALDEREEKIALQLKDAEEVKVEAQNEKLEFQRRNDEFDETRKNLFAKVSEDAVNEKKRLFNEVHRELECFRSDRLESLKKECLELSQDVTLRTQREIFAIAKKTLSDLANTRLEEGIVEMFTKKLYNLTGEKRELLLSFIKLSPQILVKSAFELLPEQRSSIEDVVKKNFSINAVFEFKTSSNLVSGIEFIVGGYKVSWNISDYVLSLEKNVNELLEEKVGNSRKGI